MKTQVSRALPTQELLPSLLAGFVIGIIATLEGITPMAALVFSGKLEPYLATGIGLTLFSSAIISIVLAIGSSFKGIIAFPVAEEMALLAGIAAAVANTMPANSGEATLLAVVAAIAVTSIATGLFLLVLGQLRVGELIRFLPFPVISGFLAGLGCLLSVGAIKVMTNISVTPANLLQLVQLPVLIHWLPGLLFGVGLLWLTRRLTHVLLLPTFVLVSIGLFYLVCWLLGMDYQAIYQQGWLLGPFPQGQLWHPFSLFTLTQVNWAAIGPQFPRILTVMLITALSLLLVSTALELATQRESDLNRELRVTGIASILSGLGGGTVGSHAIATLLAEAMGVRNRLVGIFAGLTYLGVLFLGLSLLAVFPKPIVGGLLLYLGLGLITQWLYGSWFSLPRSDYAIVLVITLIVATVGFVEGVAAGLIVAIALFVWTYSRTNVARHVFSGLTCSSQVQRSPAQRDCLRQHGDQIYILELQSFIFFGTAHQLLKQIKQRLNQGDRESLRFLVLDFRRVSGLDYSSTLSFGKIQQLARREKFTLVLTCLSPELEARLKEGKILSAEDPITLVFPDVDRGIEWCENQILATSQFAPQEEVPLQEQLKRFLVNSEQVTQLMAYLEPVTIAAGEFLFHEGDPFNGLYFIESGQVSVILRLPNGETQRIRTYLAGSTIGEIGVYLQTPRTASVIAMEPTRLYFLSNSAFEQLEQNEPTLTTHFHKFVVKLLAERLAYRDAVIKNLLN